MSIKDLILAAQDLKLEKINVPEWNVDVFLSIMTGHERSKFESQIYSNGKANTDDFHATLLVFTLKNEDGSPIFSEAEIKHLSAKSSVVLSRLAEKAAVLNGVAPDSAEEIKKN